MHDRPTSHPAPIKKKIIHKNLLKEKILKKINIFEKNIYLPIGIILNLLSFMLYSSIIIFVIIYSFLIDFFIVI